MPFPRCPANPVIVLMLKRVLEEKNAKVLLVLPYVALVQEKVRWLRNIVQGVPKPIDEIDDEKRIWRRRADEDSIRVIGFFGGSKIKPTWADFDIGVCTIEKVCDPQLHRCMFQLNASNRRMHL